MDLAISKKAKNQYIDDVISVSSTQTLSVLVGGILEIFNNMCAMRCEAAKNLSALLKNVVIHLQSKNHSLTEHVHSAMVRLF